MSKETPFITELCELLSGLLDNVSVTVSYMYADSLKADTYHVLFGDFKYVYVRTADEPALRVAQKIKNEFLLYAAEKQFLIWKLTYKNNGELSTAVFSNEDAARRFMSYIHTYSYAEDLNLKLSLRGING